MNTSVAKCESSTARPEPSESAFLYEGTWICYFLKTKQALCPPKPRELDIA